MSDRIREVLRRARDAARALAREPAARRDGALTAVAEALLAHRDEILAANAEDMKGAGDLSSALQDRLRLDEERVQKMAEAVRAVRDQPDPLGPKRLVGYGPSGIRVTRRRIPLGVIAIVYEARPNVTAECSALTIKSGNVVILRGGKEARHSNEAVARAVRAGLTEAGIPEDAVLPLMDSDRDEVKALLQATGQVDLVIPRGGQGLMSLVDELARVPVIRHGQGICHVYVDAAADRDMAHEIPFNAKVHRPGVCNALETLLVHREVADRTLRDLGPQLSAIGVRLRADDEAQAILSAAGVDAEAATDQDWDTEFLDLTLAIRVVDSLDEALDHIAEHGTHHTATIVTHDEAAAERFLQEVDASCVLWNASTRFNDGGQLGLGAEMGISTSKMHAYGPMSATELTAEKLVVYGDGQIRTG